MKISLDTKRILIFICVSVVLGGISLININPGNTFCSYYDIAQLASDNYASRYSSMWNFMGFGAFNTVFPVSPYYSCISHLSSVLNLSAAQQSFIYYYVFLSISFWGAYITLSMIKLRESVTLPVKIIFSLVYALSFYTVYAFYYQCHFSPFLYLYALVPPICVCFYRYVRLSAFSSDTRILNPESMQFLFVLLILLGFTNIINYNIPYFFSLNIFFVLFLGIFLLVKYKTINKKSFLRGILLFYLPYALIILWSVLPQAVYMSSMYNSFQSGGEIWNLNAWLLWQAMRFPEPFLMFWSSGRYIQGIPLTVYLSLALPVLAILFLSVFKKRTGSELILYILYILFIFLINRGVGWFSNELTQLIFNNPILAAIRSYDKTLIFLPGILFIIVVIFYDRLYKWKKPFARLMLVVFLTVSAISSYPIWSGQMQKKYSMINDPGKTYEESAYTGLHTYPDDYINVSNILNSDYGDYRILNAPYSVVDSASWVNYPKWKVLGNDPTVQLFDAAVIQMNSYGNAFGTWNFGQSWNYADTRNSEWLLNFASITNTKYIIYHKDVKPEFIYQTSEKMSYYLRQNLLKKIYEGEYIDVYAVGEEYFLGHLYVPSDFIFAHGDQSLLPSLFKGEEYKTGKGIILYELNASNLAAIEKYKSINITGDKSIIEWSKTDNTHYKITISNFKEYVPIIFSETYHSGWKLFPGEEYSWFTKNVGNDTHIKVNGYSNGWLINAKEICREYPDACDNGKTVTLTLEFTPQREYIITLVISATTFTAVVILLIRLLIKKRKFLEK